MSDLGSSPCETACIYSAGSENPAEMCGTLFVKARKPQKCCECGGEINPGDRYEVVSGKWEGEWLSFKTCAPCAEIRKAFCCEWWTYGTLWADAAGGFFEYMTIGCLDKLETAAAKKKLMAEWRAWKLR